MLGTLPLRLRPPGAIPQGMPRLDPSSPFNVGQLIFDCAFSTPDLTNLASGASAVPSGGAPLFALCPEGNAYLQSSSSGTPQWTITSAPFCDGSNGPFTVEVLYRFTAAISNGQLFLINGTSGAGPWFVSNYSSGWSFNQFNNSVVAKSATTTNGGYDGSLWHLVGVYDGSNLIAYGQGQFQASTPLAGIPFNAGFPWTLSTTSACFKNLIIERSSLRAGAWTSAMVAARYLELKRDRYAGLIFPSDINIGMFGGASGGGGTAWAAAGAFAGTGALADADTLLAAARFAGNGAGNFNIPAVVNQIVTTALAGRGSLTAPVTLLAAAQLAAAGAGTLIALWTAGREWSGQFAGAGTGTLGAPATLSEAAQFAGIGVGAFAPSVSMAEAVLVQMAGSGQFNSNITLLEAAVLALAGRGTMSATATGGTGTAGLPDNRGYILNMGRLMKVN